MWSEWVLNPVPCFGGLEWLDSQSITCFVIAVTVRNSLQETWNRFGDESLRDFLRKNGYLAAIQHGSQNGP